MSRALETVTADAKKQADKVKMMKSEDLRLPRLTKAEEAKKRRNAKEGMETSWRPAQEKKSSHQKKRK
jgi:hypothetical protein